MATKCIFYILILCLIRAECFMKEENFNVTILESIIEKFKEVKDLKNLSKVLDVRVENEIYRIIFEMNLLKCEKEKLNENCILDKVGICYFQIEIVQQTSARLTFSSCPFFEKAGQVTPFNSWKPLNDEDEWVIIHCEKSYSHVSTGFPLGYSGGSIRIMENGTLEFIVKKEGSHLDRNIHQNPRLIKADCTAKFKADEWQFDSILYNDADCQLSATVIIEEKSLDALSDEVQKVTQKALDIYKKETGKEINKFSVVKAIMSGEDLKFIYTIELTADCPTKTSPNAMKCTFKIVTRQFEDVADLKKAECSSCDPRNQKN